MVATADLSPRSVSSVADARSDITRSSVFSPEQRGGIVRRYFLIFATLVGGCLIASVLVELGFRFVETRQGLQTVHHQMAELAAVQIQNYVENIAQALHIAAVPRQLDDHQLTKDYAFNLRTLIKNVPSIRDVFAVGLDGRERLRVSRISESVANASVDHSSDPFFITARSGKTYFGPINFPSDSLEPRITMSVSIEAYAGDVSGVLAAEVNVRYVWDVIQGIHIGKSGYAYVVSGAGTLVAHPDLQLVLQHKDFSNLPQVAALREPGSGESGTGLYWSLSGQPVFVSYQRIPDIGWTVLVERPLLEAYAPVLISLGRTSGIMLVVCLLAVGAAVRLGRRVVKPIEVLREGAGRLEAGDLNTRLHLDTGDEFEELAEDFNRMATRLQEAYAELEQKVVVRTQALEQSLNEVRALGETIQAVSASLDLQKVLQTIVLRATQLCQSDAGLIYRFDERAQEFRFRAGHLLRPEFIGTLEAAPQTHLAAIYVAPGDSEEALVRQVTEHFPNVSAIPVREGLAAVARVIATIGNALRLVALITLAAGILVLGGAVAAGHRRRVYDSVVLKVLGATRGTIAAAFLLEHGLLGLVTAIVAAGLGTLAAYALVIGPMRSEWVFLPAPLAMILGLAVVLTLVLGFAGTWHALGAKPAAYLRNE